MNNRIKLGTLILLLAWAGSIASSPGQGVTNVALVANFALTGFRQVGSQDVMPVRITNRDIFNALNATGRFSFGSNAQLLLVSTDDQEPLIWARERNGMNVTTTDVSSFLSITQPEEVDGNNGMTSYAFRIFNFDDHNGNSFSVSGVTTLQRGLIVSRNIGPLDRVRTGTAQVTGGGTIAGAAAMFQGTVTAGSPVAEVD